MAKVLSGSLVWVASTSSKSSELVVSRIASYLCLSWFVVISLVWAFGLWDQGLRVTLWLNNRSGDIVFFHTTCLSCFICVPDGLKFMHISAFGEFHKCLNYVRFWFGLLVFWGMFRFLQTPMQ